MKEEIIELLNKVFDAESENDKDSLRNLMKDFASREERHYCAYLFAWLISSPDNIKKYFNQHNSTKGLFDELSYDDFDKCQLYYEFTGLRELIDLVGRNSNVKQHKKGIKEILEKVIFSNIKGDVQKKKPDLVFYFPTKKLMILTEAKFEGGFDEKQFDETIKYGEILEWIYPDDIKQVKMTLVGLEYYTKKYAANYPVIAWEVISSMVDNKKIKNEIDKGLIYQNKIHPKYFQINWKIKKS